MAENNLEMIKRLREETSLGMGECKNALEEAGYDYNKAVTILRERGKNIAAKKEGRATGQGLVGIKLSNKNLCVIEIGCETDFVSAGESFCELMAETLNLGLESNSKSVSELLEYSGGKAKSAITGAIAKIGENIELKKCVSMDIQSGVSYYVHNASSVNQDLGQIISVVLYKSDNPDKLKDKMRLVAMHIAATSPVYLNITDVPPEVLAEEKRIYAEQAKASGKPEQVIAKMVEGRIAKYYQDNILMEQPFVLDQDITVSKAVENMAKELGETAVITGFLLAKLAN